MSEDDRLRPATMDEIAESIAFALRYEGRKRVFHADEMMARITADRLVRHLRGSGFVVMRGAGARPPTDKPGAGDQMLPDKR
ncbi:MAG: hypothetical protein P4L90_14465 [Rhodopila sp.]|nr:hypothetical protein [Rhodopila sp.]